MRRKRISVNPLNAHRIREQSTFSDNGVRVLLFFLIFSCLLPFTKATAEMQANEPGSPLAGKLLIGTKEAPPFSFKNSAGNWQGLSIELWQIIADELQLDYSFQEYNLPGLLKALEEKSVDAAVAALTTTAEREKLFDFTHPFHTSGLGIAVLSEKKSSWLAVFNRFFSFAFLKIVTVLTVLLLVVGLLVWFFERRKNQEQFGGSTLQGVGSGFWWSAEVLLVVVLFFYFDDLFTAIIIISSFTAAITSTLTLSKIQSIVRSPEDLQRVRVGSVKLSTSATYLDKNHISFRHYASPLDAMQGMTSGEIDAVVYDAPMLRYLVNDVMRDKVVVLNLLFDKQQYGIGLPAGSPLREPINRIIPATANQQKWQDILFRYLGNISSM